MDRRTRRVLEAYSIGVNARIARIREGVVGAPRVMRALDLPLEDWRPADSLAVLKYYDWTLTNSIEASLVLDPATGDYTPEEEIKLPDLGYIDDVSALHRDGRYEEGMAVFLNAEGEHAKIARDVIAGYIAYSFERVGEVTESIDGIDRIMGLGFNAAPPSVLVDTIGAQGVVDMIGEAGLHIPSALAEAAKTGKPERFPAVRRNAFSWLRPWARA